MGIALHADDDSADETDDVVNDAFSHVAEVVIIELHHVQHLCSVLSPQSHKVLDALSIVAVTFEPVRPHRSKFDGGMLVTSVGFCQSFDSICHMFVG